VSGKTPSLGRVVHYTPGGTEHDECPPIAYAAIITKVHEISGQVTLTVFRPTHEDRPAFVDFTDAPAGTEEARGKWSWPVYVP